MSEARWLGHGFKGRGFEQTPGRRGGQESLVCCCPWGRKRWIRQPLNNKNKQQSLGANHLQAFYLYFISLVPFISTVFSSWFLELYQIIISFPS